ncbi:hypothetical protein [Schleiferia thermophila]|jgi:hypothetical protein|nr:hypothetical protein [Schleiferia thermophila]KFD39241.1 hypothetical protein AT05_06460 [Schleiferia thermophila str. Yellowstone]
MKTATLRLLSQFHGLGIAPSSNEIFENYNFNVDLQSFNAFLAQMVEDGLLIAENNKFSLPGFAHLIDETWNRDLEIQYFINHFRAVTQIVKCIPFIKGIGIARNSFLKGSNEVFLNFIVEPGTVHTTYYIVDKILSVFNRLSIFDVKVQFIFPKNEHVNLRTVEGFFAQIAHTVYGIYRFNNNTQKKCIFSRLINLFFENLCKEKALSKYYNPRFTNLFCNIENYIEKIRSIQKNQSILYA